MLQIQTDRPFQPSLFPQFADIDDLPISPFPGSKRERLIPLLGYEQYDCLISPFLGGGALELASNIPFKIVAEKDVAINTQWRYILSGHWNEILFYMAIWQRAIADMIATPGYAAYAGLTPRHRRDEAVLPGNELALVFLEGMDAIWDDLLVDLEKGDQLKQAVAALAVRKLGFGAFTRDGKHGQLNIKWALDKLASFVNFQGRQPIIKGQWKLSDQFFLAINAYSSNPVDNAVALIDPPYWLPPVDGVRNQLTPSYRGHKPHAPETLALGVDSLKSLAAMPPVRRIAYCNYYSDEMNAAVKDVAAACDRSVEFINFGVLDTAHRGNGFHRAQNIDCAWILHSKGKIMLQITDTATTTAIVSAHDLGGSMAAEPTTDSQRALKYKELCDRITQAQKETSHWAYELGKALLEMRDSQLYAVAGYANFNHFCNEVYGRSARSANLLIDASKHREEWIESGTIDPDVADKVLALREGIVREIKQAPEDQQAAIAQELVSGEEKPSMKRAQALVAEVSVPSLDTIIQNWEQVGTVTRGEGDAFSVFNEDLQYIQWDFSDRETAWRTWTINGSGYLKAWTGYKTRKVQAEAAEKARELAEAAKEEIGPEPEPVIVEVVETTSCFGCEHHEAISEGGFHCRASSFTMGQDDDYGSGCRHHKARVQSPASEFSIGRKEWAQPKTVQTPYLRELEGIELLLSSLAQEQAKLEAAEEDGSEVQLRIVEIGQGLQAILDRARGAIAA